MDPLEYPNPKDNSNKLEYHYQYKMELFHHLLNNLHHNIKIRKVSLNKNYNKFCVVIGTL